MIYRKINRLKDQLLTQKKREKIALSKKLGQKMSECVNIHVECSNKKDSVAKLNALYVLLIAERERLNRCQQYLTRLQLAFISTQNQRNWLRFIFTKDHRKHCIEAVNPELHRLKAEIDLEKAFIAATERRIKELRLAIDKGAKKLEA